MQNERPPSLPKPTKLEQFLDTTGIKPAHLAHEAGYSRQYLHRLRKGLMTPTRRCMAALAAALRRLSKTPIRVGDLFDVGKGERRSNGLRSDQRKAQAPRGCR